MTSTLLRPPAPVQAPRPAWTLRAAGALSGAAALVAGELAGRLVPGAMSPVVAVGNRVIELTPDSPRQAGISAFGSLDKPLLLGGVVLFVLLLAGSCGVLALVRRRAAYGIVGALSLLALAATAADRGATPLGSVAVGAVVLAVGVGCLHLLVPPPPKFPESGVTRRHLLLRAGVVGVATVGAGGVLKALAASAEVGALRAAQVLRPPGARATGNLAAASLGVPGITPIVTPNADFYRIDTALIVPQVDPRTYALRIGGRVDRPFTLSYAELLALPQVEADITIACVSNEVGGDLVGHARWQGVLLRDVLARAGVQRGADQVVGESVDGFTAGFPTSYALDDRTAMIALGMNGEPLPVEHGFPARLVVPGLYGYVSATKWLASITLTRSDEVDGFWIPRGWSKLGPIKIASRIDVPSSASTVPAGPVVVGGIAWAPGLRRGVTGVEVRVDGGPWQRAALGGELSTEAWRQWRWTWPADAGEHFLEVRATDATGEVQTDRRAPIAPDGASGYHGIEVTVG